MDNQDQLNNKEKYDQQRKEREQKRLNSDRLNKLKKKFGLALILVIVLFLSYRIYLSVKNNKSFNNNEPSDIISRDGIHWHSDLAIYIKGVKQEVSANLGIGIVHQPIHTHDTTGTLHLEKSGLVRKNDTRLSEFFRIWGKKFDSNCIFDTCQGSEGKVKLLVNGKENNEFQNYLMRDGDKIEIKFE